VGFPAGPQTSPVPAKILPVANQAPRKTEGLPRRLILKKKDLTKCQSEVSEITSSQIPLGKSMGKYNITYHMKFQCFHIQI
jgi:hypothetical protein